MEEWLGKVEGAMFASVKRCMKYALRDYEMRPRPQWSALHPNQVLLLVLFIIVCFANKVWCICILIT